MTKYFLCVILTVISFSTFSQSESHHPYTYDTAIAVVNASNNGNGTGGAFWKVRITRDSSYFADIAADTTKRKPAIITMPGAGEVQTGSTSDSAFFSRWGPHYWLQHGWDGSVVLGNGTHYPLLITVLQPSANVRPWYVLGLMRTLLAIFHPRGGKFHAGGLSEGSYEWNCQIMYANNTSGNQESMSYFQDITDFEGVEPEGFQSWDFTETTGYGAWATMGGRFFGLEGTHDTRNVWKLSQPMNAVVANTGYFSYEGDGSGGHCCWNDFYNPSTLNWVNTGTITNPYLVNPGAPSNTPGSYIYSATTGTSVFQWMLRQGDTTLVGASCNPTVGAGSNQSFFLPTNSTSVTGTATPNCGHTISSTTWSKISGPNTPTIVSSNSLTTSITGLIAGVYVFQLLATDNSALTGNSTVTITVNAEVPPTVNAGGNQSISLPTSSVTLTGTATGNGGATISSTTWSNVSGPNTPTITSSSSLSTVVTGLIAGTYIFQLSATDNNSNSNTSNTTVTVNTSNPTFETTIVANGEYCTYAIDSSGKMWGISSNLSLTGSNSTGIPGAANAWFGISGTKFTSVTNTLHGGVGITTSGTVYATGGTDQGQSGTGVINPSPLTVPTQITTDSAGNTLNNITVVQGTYAANIAQGLYIVKHGTASDTVYMAGDTRYGMRGDGTLGDTVSRPVKVWSLPSGKRIIQLAAERYGVALLNDGTVWTTGGSNSPGSAPPQSFLGRSFTGLGWATWGQVTGFDDSIRQIAGGDITGVICLSKTGKLWGWSFHSAYLGDASDNGYSVPTDLTTNITSFLSSGIRKISANSSCFHVICTNGTLWGWGDNAQGGIGNGVEINFATYVTPYSYDPAALLGLMQIHPVQVTNKKNFVGVFGSCLFGFTTFAVDSLNQIYVCGRNKGGVAGNGVIECTGANGDQAANYANSWDLPYPTPINPYTIPAGIPMVCPGCVSGVVTTFCNECTNPTTTLTANAGSNQTISASNTTLNGTSSTCTGGKIVYYLWTQTAGPTTSIIDVQAATQPNISNLSTGTYTFQLKVTDNSSNTKTSSVNVTVGASGCNCLPRLKFSRVKFAN